MLFQLKGAEEHSSLPHIFNDDGHMKDFSPDGGSDSGNDSTVTFVACGDTGPVRNLEAIATSGDSAHILGEMKPLLDDADFVFANVEANFSTRGIPLDRVPVFRLDPAAFDLIRQANIKIASLANNHMFDYGVDAFVDTIKILKQHGIKYFGAGLTFEDALDSAIYEVGNIKFGFVGFRDCELPSVSSNGVITPQMYKEHILTAISKLKGQVDWLIVSLHFGLEYRFVPRPADVELCHELIDGGANIILGHHPHYPQGVEAYSNGLIVYSLGNFVWDQNFAGHTASSYVLQISVDKKKLQAVRAVPFYMDRDYQICLHKGDEALAEIDLLSSLLTDQPTFDREWYFITRDHFQLFLQELKRKLFIGPAPLFVWWKERLGQRHKNTLKDFFKYVLRLKAFRYEYARLRNK